MENKLVYTHKDPELNQKISELMCIYDNFIEYAKKLGLDVRLYPHSETLELYYNDDYPDTLLVDKEISSKVGATDEEEKDV